MALETGIDITTATVDTGSTGAEQSAPSGQDSVNFGGDLADSGQGAEGQDGTPTGQVEQTQTKPTDPNLTPENLAAYRASLTQESQKLAAQRAQLEAQAREAQSWKEQAREAQIYREQAVAAQTVLQHPAIRQALTQNVEHIADAMIQRGIVQPHERAQLIAEIRKNPQVQQMQQAQVQQMQPQYQPPAQDISALVQAELKRYEEKRTIDEQVNRAREEFKQLHGREASNEEVQGLMQFAIQELVNNPLKHALKVQNFEKIKSDAIAQARLQIMRDLQNGADPFHGAVLPVNEDPGITKMKQDIFNASI